MDVYVAVYVKDTRGVHYAYKTVWEVLRKEKKVKYGKAYKMNSKRPPQRRRDFEKNLDEALSDIREKEEYGASVELDESGTTCRPACLVLEEGSFVNRY